MLYNILKIQLLFLYILDFSVLSFNPTKEWNFEGSKEELLSSFCCLNAYDRQFYPQFKEVNNCLAIRTLMLGFQEETVPFGRLRRRQAEWIFFFLIRQRRSRRGAKGGWVSQNSEGRVGESEQRRTVGRVRIAKEGVDESEQRRKGWVSQNSEGRGWLSQNSQGRGG